MVIIKKLTLPRRTPEIILIAPGFFDIDPKKLMSKKSNEYFNVSVGAFERALKRCVEWILLVFKGW